MTYVYLLQSLAHPQQRYTGATTNLKTRLQNHNEGKSRHTANHKPWRLMTYVAFTDAGKALAFERYLKTGSGRALARKHLWP